MTGPRGNKDYDWAFGLRAFNCDSSDDDSDKDGQPPLSIKKQHEVRLEDFDLGSREESVSYKPNPFSIAKINAAYRSARNGGSEAKSSLPQNGVRGKACGLVQSKIDEILKKQESCSSKKVAATKGYRPGASYPNSEISTKQTRPKNGSGVDRAFFRPQNSNTNPEFEVPSTVRSGCSPSLEPTLLSANAHILTHSKPNDAPSLPNEEPACVLPSPSDSDGQCIKPDSMSPFRGLSLFSSPMRSTASKLEGRSISPELESRPLSTSQHNFGFVELRHVGHPASFNSDPVDQKCSADHQVKQEFCQSSEMSVLGRAEENVHLSQASAPLIFPRNRDECLKPLAMNTGPFRAPAPLPTVHLPKRQTMAQVTSPVVPLKRNVRDAYSFSVEDPDANWSTLPTRKKQMSKSLHPSRVTKSFRLPGLLPPQKIVKTETDDTSGKRVVTYLPPPLMRHADESRHPSALRLSYPISRVQDEKMSLARRSPPLAATSYLSPSHLRISRPSQVYPVSKTNLAPSTREQVIEVYRPPSPPTSDPPAASSEGANVRIQVDLRVIRDTSSRAQRDKVTSRPFR